MIKPSSLVTVRPARAGLYLVIRDLPEMEISWPAAEDGIPLGKLWELYDPSDQETKMMHEKFIEVVG